MKVGLYNESAGGVLGGSEYLTAVLADDLARDHEVDLVHHHEGLTVDRLQTFTGLALYRVGLRFVPKTMPAVSTTSAPWRIWRESRRWQADVSQPYDVFVNVVHTLPSFCHARQGVLLVLFPLSDRARVWPLNDPPDGLLDVRRQIRNRYYAWEWKQRLKSYARAVSISSFTQHWTRLYWGLDSSVVYPPVALAPPHTIHKAPRILSVGRFSSGGHPKRHPELIAAIGAIDIVASGAWEYHSVGALGQNDSDQGYFADVQAIASRHGAVLHTNVTRDALADHYASASLFVHGAGYLAPEDKPELTEHFGIATVEAMAAGCVPLVVNRGAQPEIVRHGETGFVWNTLEELQAQIVRLAGDDRLRQRMAAAAAADANRFGREHFTTGMRRILDLPVGP